MNKSSSFLVYTASAGSGKTFTLVKEYLIKIFTTPGNDGFKHILAITFTNKAVAEMKSRIIKNLIEIAAHPEGQELTYMQIELCSILNKNNAQLKQKAQSILVALLHNYAAFSVETIDSFNHRLIRTFAKDLGLNTNFEVTLDVKLLLSQAVDRYVSKAGVDQAVTDTLVAFALSKTEQDKSWDVTFELNNVATLLISEPHFKNLTRLLAKEDHEWDALKTTLEKRESQLKTSIKQAASQFFQRIQSQGLLYTDFSRSSIPKHFEMVQAMRLDINWNTAMRANISEAAFYTKTQSEDKKALIDEIRPEIEALFLESKEALFAYGLTKALLQGLVPLSVLRAINSEFEALKEELNVVTITEFNRRINEQIKDQPAPFIYERLGDRYRHFFIDEFQDTSQMQWTNLLPLVENALAQLYSDDSAGSLMIVGDAKQAIYRWRGGASEQFISLYQGESPFSTTPTPKTLDTNYRSHSEIVLFNNQFFSYASQFLSNEAYQLLYKDGNAQKTTTKEGGYVQFSFVTDSLKSELQESIPRKVEAILQDCLARGYALKDICILTRRKEESLLMANYLKQKDLLVQSTDSVLVANSELVQFVVSMLQLLVNFNDAEARFQVLQFLHEHSQATIPLHDYLKHGLAASRGQLEAVWDESGYSFNFLTFESKELYEAVEYLIQAFNLQENVDAFLRSFLEHVHSFEQKNDASLTGFLEFWEQKKEDLGIPLTKQIDAVNIMTVHSSKGLQFEVVIFPFANSSFENINKDDLWIPLNPDQYAGFDAFLLRSSSKMDHFGAAIKQVRDRQKQVAFYDELNVLYVSMTRAIGELYVIGKQEKPSAKSFSSLFVSYLDHMGLWDEAQLDYRFGAPLQKVQEASDSEVTAIKEAVFLSTPTQSHALSLVAAQDVTKTAGIVAKERGIRIHNWLSHIITQDDVEGLFLKQRSLSKFKAEVLNQDQELVNNIISHPELQQYFKVGVRAKNEVDLIDNDGNILRPDRLNFQSNDQVTIIDYKIGQPDTSYRTQLNAYEKGLRDLGFKEVKKILVYYQEDILIDSW
ncbi:MAG: UvrD-helicase domain-containing protein [Gilvibacter sp.]